MTTNDQPHRQVVVTAPGLVEIRQTPRPAAGPGKGYRVPAQGDRSPFLDTYLRQCTRTLTGVGEGTFPLALRHRP